MLMLHGLWSCLDSVSTVELYFFLSLLFYVVKWCKDQRSIREEPTWKTPRQIPNLLLGFALSKPSTGGFPWFFLHQYLRMGLSTCWKNPLKSLGLPSGACFGKLLGAWFGKQKTLWSLVWGKTNCLIFAFQSSQSRISPTPPWLAPLSDKNQTSCLTESPGSIRGSACQTSSTDWVYQKELAHLSWALNLVDEFTFSFVCKICFFFFFSPHLWVIWVRSSLN